jgi:hypothetical protein
MSRFVLGPLWAASILRSLRMTAETCNGRRRAGYDSKSNDLVVEEGLRFFPAKCAMDGHPVLLLA